jgi:hypothetical protein
MPERGRAFRSWAAAAREVSAAIGSARRGFASDAVAFAARCTRLRSLRPGALADAKHGGPKF